MLKDKKNLYIIIAIFIVAVLVLYRASYNSNKPIDSESLSKITADYLDKINDNYTLDIIMYKNEEEYKLSYMTDGNVKMYSSDTFPKTGYLVYNGKNYYIENNKIMTSKVLDINRVFNEKLYDIKLIKSVLNKCSYNISSLINASCKIRVSDFFEEYNKLYDENIVSDLDNEIEIEVLYNNNGIEGARIIYDNVVEVLTKNKDNIEYDILIKDVNKNDFSLYIPLIEKKN